MKTLPRPIMVGYSGFGAVALSLGVIGAILSIFPVLGIPISAVGLLAGLMGLLVQRVRGGAGLRLCIAGTIVAFLALILDLVIGIGPAGLVPQLEVPHNPPPRISNGVPETPPPEQ